MNPHKSSCSDNEINNNGALLQIQQTEYYRLLVFNYIQVVKIIVTSSEKKSKKSHKITQKSPRKLKKNHIKNHTKITQESQRSQKMKMSDFLSCAADSPCVRSGAKLVMLKEHLREQMKMRRKASREKRNEELDLDNEEGFEEDEEGELTDQTDTDDDEDREEEEEEEVGVDEDDDVVTGREMKRKKVGESYTCLRIIIIIAEMAVFNVAGYLIEERRGRPVIYCLRGQ